MEDRIEIIEEIVAVFEQTCPKTGNQQPHVYFRGTDVRVRLGNPVFLEALWRAHVFFKGKRMDIVSKGLNGYCVRVFEVRGLEAKRLDDARKSMQSYKWCLAVARVYEAPSLGGGPIFSGDLLVFTTYHMKKLWGRHCFCVPWCA